MIINFVVFALELNGGEAFVLKWSAIPAHVTAGHDWITILTAMFMHGSWSHILGNMVFLWAFGPEIEDAMGPAKKYGAFYLLGGARIRRDQNTNRKCGAYTALKTKRWLIWPYREQFSPAKQRVTPSI